MNRKLATLLLMLVLGVALLATPATAGFFDRLFLSSDSLTGMAIGTNNITCTDTDGADTTIKGTVKYGAGTFSDLCYNSMVIEYLCSPGSEGNFIAREIYVTCPYGCSNGACLGDEICELTADQGDELKDDWERVLMLPFGETLTVTVDGASYTVRFGDYFPSVDARGEAAQIYLTEKSGLQRNEKEIFSLNEIRSLAGLDLYLDDIFVDTIGDNGIQARVYYRAHEEPLFEKLWPAYKRCYNGNAEERQCYIAGGGIGMISQGVGEVCQHGCVDGECIEALVCTDSDGGLNYYVKGVLIDHNGVAHSDYCTDEPWADFTANLVEYTCPEDGFGRVANGYACPNGCENGACRTSPPVITCEDSDGLDTTTKGQVVRNGQVYTDICSATDRVKEYACSFDDEVLTLYSHCNSRCVDGVCLDEPICADATGIIYDPYSLRYPFKTIVLELYEPMVVLVGGVEYVFSLADDELAIDGALISVQVGDAIPAPAEQKLVPEGQFRRFFDLDVIVEDVFVSTIGGFDKSARLKVREHVSDTYAGLQLHWCDGSYLRTRSCLGNSGGGGSLYCAYGCADGACLPAPYTCDNGIKDGDETGVDCGGSCPACKAACLDMDVGNNPYYTKSEVWYAGNGAPLITDRCNGITLVEGVCTGAGDAATVNYNCPYGCQNGACVPAPSVTCEYEDVNDCVADQRCTLNDDVTDCILYIGGHALTDECRYLSIADCRQAYGCIVSGDNSHCVEAREDERGPISLRENPICRDTDNGRDYFEAGYVHMVADWTDCDGTGACNDHDACVSDELLREFYCDPSGPNGLDDFTLHTCAFGCESGACRTSPPAHCYNGITDDDEEGVDCGGFCQACAEPVDGCLSFTDESSCEAQRSCDWDGLSCHKTPVSCFETDGGSDDIFTKGSVAATGPFYASFGTESLSVGDARTADVPISLTVYPGKQASLGIMGPAQPVMVNGVYTLGFVEMRITDISYDDVDYEDSYVEFEIRRVYDYCDEDGRLIEYSCDGAGGFDDQSRNCAFGCVDGACVPSADCANGIRDNDEDGVDCGGVCARGCSPAPPPPVPVDTCYNGVLDADEEGVDCGGPCAAPCAAPPNPPDPNGCSDGCAHEGGCVRYGYRVESELHRNRVMYYCDLSGDFLKAKAEGDACVNDYECATNMCVDGQCFSKSFWKRLGELLAKWF